MTRGAMGTFVKTVSAWLWPGESGAGVAGPASPDAVNVACVATPAAVAVRVLLLVPAVWPSLHDVSVAVPLASVRIGVAGVASAPVPPPDATNVTDAFWTRLVN